MSRTSKSGGNALLDQWKRRGASTKPPSSSKGKWAYFYRGVDTEGQTIDFFLSEQRDIAAAKRFLPQAIKKRGVPEKVTLDGYAASHIAVAELQEEDVLPRRS